MTGFQIFLCVLGGLIALIWLILSIPVHVSFSYQDKLYLTVRYLFVKINVLPLQEKEKKPKKQKKPKKEKPKEEEKEEEQKPKEKKPNAIVEMVKANGFDGMVSVLQSLGHVFSLYGGKLLKSVVFDEIDVYMVVGKGDAAETAIAYGKMCQKVYPLVGFLCSNNVVHKYDVSVEPDFLANSSKGEIFIDFHLIIRKVINATVGMAVRLVFQVLLKFIKGAKKNKTDDAGGKGQRAETAVQPVE